MRLSFKWGQVLNLKEQSSRDGHASIAALVLGVGLSVVLVGAHPSSSNLVFGAPTLSDIGRTDAAEIREILDRYCVRCHNQSRLTAGLALDALDIEDLSAATDKWEKVVRKLRTGTMPPGDVARPDPADYDLAASWLETELDRAASAAEPNPGTTNPVHRLNRLE